MKKEGDYSKFLNQRATQTGPLPKGGETKPLTPPERRRAREASPSHWQNLEERASDIRGTIWDFIRHPSPDHIDSANDLMKEMVESWEVIARDELAKLTDPKRGKIKKTTDKEKLQNQFEAAFGQLLKKEWNDLPRTERIEIYNQLFTSHTSLQEMELHHIAKLMQKARIAYQNAKQ